MNRKKLINIVFIIFMNINIFSQESNNETLRKHIIIENYDINRIKVIIMEICIWHNMVNASGTNLFPNQELLYYRVYNNESRVDINLSSYIVIYKTDNIINILIHDPLFPRSKWFDNFPLDILGAFNRNGIIYQIVN